MTPSTGNKTQDAVADTIGTVIGTVAAFVVIAAGALLFLYFFVAGLQFLIS